MSKIRNHYIDTDRSYKHMVFFVDRCICGKTIITTEEEDRKQAWSIHREEAFEL